MEKLIRFLEQNSMSCFYKKHFGIECPGCGFQRSLIHLLKGEFVESFQLYPALLTTIFMIGFLLVHLVFKIKNGHKVLLWLFIVNTALMVGNYLVKLL
ncbi:MAG TPA: DUF2752 domain-containing protein [Bacteroidales bacterium]|nr:DUF2752 domain-containing protein [Bacteroidales bacterium]